MSGFMSREQVNYIKERYPEGTRIQLDSMGDDPRPITPGTTGTVQCVDDIGTVHCAFDDGRYLGLVPGEDSFHIVQQEQSAGPEMSM